MLILGATGNAGRLAVQVAKRLGAGEIIAAGRGAERMSDLGRLGASRIVELDDRPATVADDLGDAGKNVDVVLDFLWGSQPRTRCERSSRIVPTTVSF